MKLLMTLMLSAEPCVKSAVLAGSKLSSFLPSKPAPKTMVGSEQEPKSRSELLAAAPPDDAAALVAAAVAAAAAAVVEEALAAQAEPAVALEAAAAAVVAEDEATLALEETPATAAVISSAVASSTSLFWVKMQPTASLASSQTFPAAVGSPILPGANVPAFKAVCGSPPMEAICLASSRVIALLVAAALSEAGS